MTKKRRRREKAGDTDAKHYSGQFFVLLWPEMEKVKGLNWEQAEKLWRNHPHRAMILAMSDLKGGKTIETT